ncbi:MAG: hypothetical protein AAF648_04190 [Pseudomonadota bacterium]
MSDGDMWKSLSACLLAIQSFPTDPFQGLALMNVLAEAPELAPLLQPHLELAAQLTVTDTEIHRGVIQSEPNCIRIALDATGAAQTNELLLDPERSGEPGRVLDLSSNENLACVRAGVSDLKADSRCDALLVRLVTNGGYVHAVLTAADADVRGSGLPGAVYVLSVPMLSSLAQVATNLKQVGLTSAEASLAERLVLGSSLTELAQHSGLSVHTLRTQLKSINRKLGISSQAQLVGASHQLAFIGRTGTQRFDGQGVSLLHELPDERSLEIVRFGEAAQRNVIGFSGSLESGLLNQQQLSSTLSEGWAYWAYQRPGYGRSAVHPQPTIDRVRDDAGHWLASAAVGPFVAFGRANGAKYALALTDHRNCIGAVLLDPIATHSLGEQGKLHPFKRSVNALPKFPALGHAFGKIMAAAYTEERLRWVLKELYSTSVDREVIEDSVRFDALVESVRVAICENWSGIADETRVSVTERTSLRFDSSVPIVMLYSEVLEPDEVARMKLALSAARSFESLLLKGSGRLVAHRRWDAVLEAFATVEAHAGAFGSKSMV